MSVIHLDYMVVNHTEKKSDNVYSKHTIMFKTPFTQIIYPTLY